MKNLKEIREKIDAADDQIIKLLEQRISLAIETKKFKVKFEDRKREKEILEKISNPCIKNIYKSIFSNIKKIIKSQP